MKFGNILKSLCEIVLTVEETDNTNDNFAVYLHVIKVYSKISMQTTKETKEDKREHKRNNNNHISNISNISKHRINYKKIPDSHYYSN